MKQPPRKTAKKPAPGLKKVIDTLKKKGASEVRVIKAADVIVDQTWQLRMRLAIP